jgi:hypothetical protein
MQYNFEVRTALPDDEVTTAVSVVVEGLQASANLIVGVKVRLNTELPDDKLESLTEAVSQLMTDKLGTEVSAVLTSNEH